MIQPSGDQEISALPRSGSPAPARFRNGRAAVALTVVGVLGVVLLVVGTRNVLPMTGQADASAMGPRELAELALDSVQYLQTLTTAVFAGAMLVLSQKALGRWTKSDDSWARIAVASGFVVLVFSLAAGFVQIELITEAADQQLLDEKMSNLRLLRVIQSGLLLVGVIVIGAPLLHDLLRGEGPVAT